MNNFILPYFKMKMVCSLLNALLFRAVSARGILKKKQDCQLSGGFALVVGVIIVLWEVYARTIGIGLLLGFLEVFNLTLAALIVTGVTGLYQVSKK